MKRRAPMLDVVFMVGATNRSKMRMEEIVNLANNMQNDPEFDQRADACLCLPCYYLPSVGGASMTTQDCACCHKPEVYSSTNTDVLCISCAVDHSLCKHCGGDIDLRRRNKWPQRHEKIQEREQ